MKTIKFLETRIVRRPGQDHLTFPKDSIHELNNASANHWLKRGYAVELSAAEAAAAVAAAGDMQHGNPVDSAADVGGQNGGGDGQRTVDDARGGGIGAAVRRLLGGHQ